MKQKISILIFFLLLTNATYAAELRAVGKIENPSLMRRIAAKVWECTWHISCYTAPKLGADSITAITGTTLLSDLDIVLTNNNTYFDERKVNISSSTWPQLTTATGLTSVGTLTSFRLSGNAGLGTSSPYAALSVVGGGHFTASTTIPGVRVASSTLQFNLLATGSKVGICLDVDGSLTTSGCPVATIDQSTNYTWTGEHVFRLPAGTSTSVIFDTNWASGRTASTTFAGRVQFGGPITGLPSDDWQQVGETVSSSTGTTIAVNNLPVRKFYVINMYAPGMSGSGGPIIRFNGDTAANYSYRYSANGGADGNGVSQTSITGAITISTAFYINATIQNTTNSPKIILIDIGDAAANAGAVPQRGEIEGNWFSTANISTIAIVSVNAETFNSGSRLTIFSSKD